MQQEQKKFVYYKKIRPKQFRKNTENEEGGLKENEGWTKPTKCVPIACFYKKNESNENDNNSDNRYDVFAEEMELENEKHEEESAKIIIEEK